MANIDPKTIKPGDTVVIELIATGGYTSAGTPYNAEDKSISFIGSKTHRANLFVSSMKIIEVREPEREHRVGDIIILPSTGALMEIKVVVEDRYVFKQHSDGNLHISLHTVAYYKDWKRVN